MNIFDEIAIYLPKYLSESSSEVLKAELKKFPTDGTKPSIYTTALEEKRILFQGDGINLLKIVDMQKEEFKEVSAILLSNTCDMDLSNIRLFNTQICYAPILDLEKYRKNLMLFLLNREKEKKELEEEEIQAKVLEMVQTHIGDIKKQRITQILFLPKGRGLSGDSLVFLDRIFNAGSQTIDRISLESRRLFPLSDYGLYLFLLKLSIHFTRIQERVDRLEGVIL